MKHHTKKSVTKAACLPCGFNKVLFPQVPIEVEAAVCERWSEK